MLIECLCFLRGTTVAIPRVGRFAGVLSEGGVGVATLFICQYCVYGEPCLANVPFCTV